jgi:DNA-binding NtrC family response regulator
VHEGSAKRMTMASRVATWALAPVPRRRPVGIGRTAYDLGSMSSPDRTETLRHQGRRKRGRRPGRLTLRVLDGPDAGKEEIVTGSRIRVGRGAAADFTVEHPSLSGLHFELRVRRDGVELFDLASKNGTVLCGRRVYHARVELGDVIVAGGCGIQLVDAADVEIDQGFEAREDGLLGQSDAIQEMFAVIDVAASCELPTLVHGETGSGKELVARAMHRRSSRSKGPFIVRDCSTLPKDLAESAILGHCKGAFTGADDDRRGAFEEASGGTLFLDEIGELALELQVKLLRAVDRQEIVRVGENEPRRVDTRVVAATHADVPHMVDAGLFREDLFYRLNGLTIEIPSLRDRGADEIEYLANAFLADHATMLQRGLSWSGAAMEALRMHRWPGNVRELKAVVARAVVMRVSDTIELEALALRVQRTRRTRLEESARLGTYDEAHAELDRSLLPRILAECGGDIEAAARRLDRPARALIKRMHDLGIYSPKMIPR